MPVFSFTPQYDDNPPEGVERDFPTREAAIEHAKDLLSAVLIKKAHAVRTASVGVGEGSIAGEDVEWFGAWDWTPDGGWVWSADD